LYEQLKAGSSLIMQVSANEVYQTARKACLAAGYLQDRAEDIAVATSWLQCAGMMGCTVLDSLLADTQDKKDIQLGLHLEAGVLQISQCRPAFEGVASIDWLLAADSGAQIQIACLSHPVMFAGLLWQAGQAYQRQFRLVSEALEPPINIPDETVDSVATCQQISGKLVVGISDSAPPPSFVASGHSVVSDAVWARLNALAMQTYVPETEASRLSGAGAGLVDDD